MDPVFGARSDAELHRGGAGRRLVRRRPLIVGSSADVLEVGHHRVRVFGNPVKNSVRSLGALVRLGFDIRILSGLSLYPRLMLGAGNRHQTLSSLFATSDESANFVWAGVSLPALLHAADHFFIGFGPSVSHDFQRTLHGTTYQNRGTTVGASALVGAWL